MTALKRCPCPEHEGPRDLPLDKFSANRTQPDGLEGWCRECKNRAARARFAAGPAKKRASTRRREEALREQVLGHYGRSCACCGTTVNLNISHVRGSAIRQKLFGSATAGWQLYRWLIDSGFPAGVKGFPGEFKVLCLPCMNSSRGRSGRCRLDHTAMTLAE